MPNVTENYGLKKPLPEEFYDVQVHNDNMDIIDEELKKRTGILVTTEVPSDSDFWIDPDEESVEEAHVNDTNNPHGVTAEQVGAVPTNQIAGLQTKYLTLLAGESVKFSITAYMLLIGRLTTTPTVSAAAYILSAYDAFRPPIITELSVGDNITVSTSGDNTNGWYVEITNTHYVSSCTFYMIGNCSPNYV